MARNQPPTLDRTRLIAFLKDDATSRVPNRFTYRSSFSVPILELAGTGTRARPPRMIRLDDNVGDELKAAWPKSRSPIGAARILYLLGYVDDPKKARRAFRKEARRREEEAQKEGREARRRQLFVDIQQNLLRRLDANDVTAEETGRILTAVSKELDINHEEII